MSSCPPTLSIANLSTARRQVGPSCCASRASFAVCSTPSLGTITPLYSGIPLYSGAAGAAGAGVAQVADYITDANCKANYIRLSKPACVADGKCSPVGSEGCT